MVPKKAQIWIRYRKCRDKATDTQSQGDPKIVKRGPNFEQKIRIFQNCSHRFRFVWTNIHPQTSGMIPATVWKGPRILEQPQGQNKLLTHMAML